MNIKHIFTILTSVGILSLAAGYWFAVHQSPQPTEDLRAPAAAAQVQGH